MDLDFVSEEGELVTYTVKPNYRTLGPRFGKGMPQVAAAVAALDASSVASTVAEGGEVGISIDGHDHTLGTDDLIMALAPLEGYEVEAEAGHAVALQLEIDEELRRAGLAREVVRAVQDARKNAGLEITDRIELGLGGDAELLEVAREHEAYIAGETLATGIAFGDEDGAGSTVSAATIDTRELRISVHPV
jgi:isoleucyl-tRNA synthetase